MITTGVLTLGAIVCFLAVWLERRQEARFAEEQRRQEARFADEGRRQEARLTEERRSMGIEASALAQKMEGTIDEAIEGLTVRVESGMGIMTTAVKRAINAADFASSAQGAALVLETAAQHHCSLSGDSAHNARQHARIAELAATDASATLARVDTVAANAIALMERLTVSTASTITSIQRTADASRTELEGIAQTIGNLVADGLNPHVPPLSWTTVAYGQGRSHGGDPPCDEIWPNGGVWPAPPAPPAEPVPPTAEALPRLEDCQSLYDAIHAGHAPAPAPLPCAPSQLASTPAATHARRQPAAWTRALPKAGVSAALALSPGMAANAARASLLAEAMRTPRPVAALPSPRWRSTGPGAPYVGQPAKQLPPRAVSAAVPAEVLAAPAAVSTRALATAPVVVPAVPAVAPAVPAAVPEVEPAVPADVPAATLVGTPAARPDAAQVVVYIIPRPQGHRAAALPEGTPQPPRRFRLERIAEEVEEGTLSGTSAAVSMKPDSPAAAAVPPPRLVTPDVEDPEPEMPDGILMTGRRNVPILQKRMQQHAQNGCTNCRFQNPDFRKWNESMGTVGSGELIARLRVYATANPCCPIALSAADTTASRTVSTVAVASAEVDAAASLVAKAALVEPSVHVTETNLPTVLALNAGALEFMPHANTTASRTMEPTTTAPPAEVDAAAAVAGLMASLALVALDTLLVPASLPAAAAADGLATLPVAELEPKAVAEAARVVLTATAAAAAGRRGANERVARGPPPSGDGSYAWGGARPQPAAPAVLPAAPMPAAAPTAATSSMAPAVAALSARMASAPASAAALLYKAPPGSSVAAHHKAAREAFQAEIARPEEEVVFERDTTEDGIETLAEFLARMRNMATAHTTRVKNASAAAAGGEPAAPAAPDAAAHRATHRSTAVAASGAGVAAAAAASVVDAAAGAGVAAAAAVPGTVAAAAHRATGAVATAAAPAAGVVDAAVATGAGVVAAAAATGAVAAAAAPGAAVAAPRLTTRSSTAAAVLAGVAGAAAAAPVNAAAAAYPTNRRRTAAAAGAGAAGAAAAPSAGAAAALGSEPSPLQRDRGVMKTLKKQVAGLGASAPTASDAAVAKAVARMRESGVAQLGRSSRH